MEHGYLKGLKERVSFLEESQFWTRKDLENYQLNQLVQIVRHAYENVPFYKKSFDNCNLCVSEIKSMDDLSKIPLIDKNIIKNNHLDFRAINYNEGDFFWITTGGSTGDPFKIYIDERFKAYNHANTYFYLRVLMGRGFFQHDHRSIRLHGDILPDEKIRSNIFWEEKNNKLVMSSYNLTKETIELYVEQINGFKPEYIHAYPSAIALLAKYIYDFNLTIDVKLNCIFCDCEALYEYQKDYIKKAFSCPIYQVYGHTEGATVGIQCRQSDYLHFVPQVGILELLRPDGSKVDKENEEGEIVVTGFNNWVMPFIRYKTGDLGVWTDKKCKCGRQWPLLHRVKGRLQDYAVDKRGNVFALGPVLFDYNINWAEIDRFQIYQDTKGELLFRIKVLDGSLRGADQIRTSFAVTLEEIFKNIFDVKVEVVKDIEFTKIGKFRYLEQKLDIRDFYMTLGCRS